jgi:hypothetical protein
MIPDGEPYWIHSTGQTVLTKGIAFGDDAEFIANAPTDIALLLTKLDETEKENAKLRGVNHALERRCLDAQGREVTLIAGVKEAERILGYGQRREARAILSRLLPSTPTSAHPGHLGEIRARDARDVLGVQGEKGGWDTGGFTTDLIRTIARADPENRGRLRQAFPGLVAAVEAYSNLDGGVEILQQIAAQPEHSGAVE